MNNAQRVARWLRPMVFPQDVTVSPVPDRIEVRHVNVNEKSAPVREIPISIDGQAALTALADEVDYALTEDANGLGGIQKYILTCWRADKCLGRATFRARGEEDEDDKDVMSEPATNKGLLAQLMRHNEATMKIAFVQASASERAMASLERQNALLASVVEGAFERQIEAVKLVEDLHNERAKRDLKLLEAQGRIDTRQQMGKQILPLLATVVSKFTGQANGEPNAEVMQYRTFVASLTPEQMEAFAASLTPPQQIALFEMMKQMRENEEQSSNGAS